jgi:hypothetical protein
MAVAPPCRPVSEHSYAPFKNAAPHKTEVARLGVFAGLWHVEGHVYVAFATPSTSASRADGFAR